MIRLMTLCLVLPCCTGCLTAMVHNEVGYVEEWPDKPLSVALDEDREILVIVYVAERERFGGEQSVVVRRLDVPYGECEDLVIGKLADLTEADFQHVKVAARGERTEKIVQSLVRPEHVWETTDVPAYGDNPQRRLPVVAYAVGPLDQCEAAKAVLGALRTGHPVYQGFLWARTAVVFVPRKGKVLQVPLPHRREYVPGSWKKRAALYPLTVAGDILAAPIVIPAIAVGSVVGLLMYAFTPG